VLEGSFTGTYITPLRLPVLGILPQFEQATIGTRDTVFPNGATGILPPGRYRDVTLQPQASISLVSGGLYEIRNLWVKSGASLKFPGPAVVRVQGGFNTENGTYIGPQPNSDISASDILFYVASTDSASSFSQAVIFGPQATVAANVDAPFGSVWLKDQTKTGDAGFNSVIGGADRVFASTKLSQPLQPFDTDPVRTAEREPCDPDRVQHAGPGS
jgi:hypothetical protein